MDLIMSTPNYSISSDLAQLWSSYPQELAGLKSLCLQLDYSFKNPDFLYEALTHRSAVISFDAEGKCISTENLSKSLRWNERLEFLGDSVLGLAISSKLWNNAEHWDEGKLSRIRSYLVCQPQLAQIALDLSLPNCLILGKGEMQSGGKFRESLLADALEAVIGAIYCDSGFDAASKVIEKLFEQHFASQLTAFIEEDYKSQLQVLAQEKFRATPTYETIDAQGPDHAKEFEVAAFIHGKQISQGKGPSKKKASQEAAKLALAHFEDGNINL